MITNVQWSLLVIYRSEFWILLKGSMIRAFNLGYFSFSLPLLLFVVFSVYTSTGGELTPKGVFTVLSFLTGLRLTGFHYAVKFTLTASEANVALKRIQVGVTCCAVLRLVAIRYNYCDNYRYTLNCNILILYIKTPEAHNEKEYANGCLDTYSVIRESL